MSASSVNLIVLDVLKPHKPNILEYAKRLSSIKSSYKIDIKVIEVDEKTETIKLTISGRHIKFDEIEQIIASLGGSIHSVDEVSVA